MCLPAVPAAYLSDFENGQNIQGKDSDNMATAKTPQVVEIEIDGPRNESSYFQPIAKHVRGRLTFAKIANKNAMVERIRWPNDHIPGCVIGYDYTTGTGYVRDRLYEPEYEDVRRHIEVARKQVLGPERTETPHADLSTWCYWMDRICDAGHATVIAGEFPAVLPSEPKKDFFTRADSETEKLKRENSNLKDDVSAMRSELAELRGLVKGAGVGK
jgi:hypothetical protein